MNTHNFKDQSAFGKTILIFTYPLAIGIHFQEWRKMKRLQRNIKKWIGPACRNSNSVEAQFVKEWSEELHCIYGK
mgnify:CR=1 FL=1|tara:strand:+ start:577 stop:801 length:225 start_codon:yes stop_codon:yes gene_type:complete